MPQADIPYPHLFSPFALSGVELRNRIVHASMTTKMGVDQQVTERLLNYHRNRAAGGAAMIVTEPLAMLPWHQEPYKVNVWADDAQAGLQRWAAAVEGENCRLIAQLQDSGRGRHESGQHPHAVGPSALPDDLSWTVARAMTVTDIEQLIERCVAAAGRLQQLGFSGIEVSAGHGHLFHQFLSPWSNQRDDDYGGSLENRCRLVKRLAAGVRDECGANFIVGLRLPGDDGVPDSIDLNQAARLTAELADPRVVSYLTYAQGAHAPSLAMHLPDMHGPRTPFVELLRSLKKSAGEIPLMAVGLITDPAEAERIIADDDAQLIGLGRALVTDCAWPGKAQQGRAAEIRYCVSCNTCWATIVRDGRPIACDNNPRVGEKREVDWWPRLTDSPRCVVVVGSGVAGLEAAWVAAARGHDVTLLCRSDQLGGKTWLHAQLPGSENISSVYDYQIQAAQRAGVKIEVAGLVTVDAVTERAPDQVILATGARMQWPRQLPQVLEETGYVPDLRQSIAELIHHQSTESGTAVVYDHDHSLATYAAAERLKEIFARVILVTPRETVAQQEALVTRQIIYQQLNERGIEIAPFSVLGDCARLEDGVMMVRNVYTGDETAIDDLALLTYSTPRVAQDGLYADLSAAGVPVTLVGDCYRPATLLAATAQGHAVGNALCGD